MIIYLKVKNYCILGDVRVEVYKKVREYIEDNGYKQVAIAEKAGISKVTFNAILNGKRTMYADDLKAICLALNVSPELFINIPKNN